MSRYCEQKGEEGELLVYGAVKNILDKMNYDYRIVRNAILPFKSVYGEQGYITAEFDILIFTPFLIILIEIKNECYIDFDYDAPLWKLINGEMVSNPINQNHTHKLVFCSELSVPREKVISIEILLENGKIELKKSPFINDYIFDKKEFSQKLMYLFATEFDDRLDVEKLYQTFITQVKKHDFTKQDHLGMLKHTEKIETRIKNVIGRVNLRRTDIIRCSSCGVGELIFRDMSYRSTKENMRSSRHYALGCSNYKRQGINCKCGLIYVDANKSKKQYLAIEPVHIEEKNHWGDEKMVKTVLDEINKLSIENAKLIDQLEEVSDTVARVLQEKNDVNEKYKDACKKVLNAQNEINDLKEHIKRYKKVFRSLYIYKDV